MEDHQFLLEMSRARRAEVQLAGMAAKKARDPEVLQLAERIVKDHTNASNELKGLATKLGVELPKDLGRHQERVARLNEEPAGPGFEANFVRAMLKDHERTRQDLERAIAESKDAEIKQWAAKFLPLVKKHESVSRQISKRMGPGEAPPEPPEPPGPPKRPPLP